MSGHGDVRVVERHAPSGVKGFDSRLSRDGNDRPRSNDSCPIPLSAGEIVSRTRLSQPNASMHLACLAECGLVTRERQGKFVHYEIADKRVVKLLDQAEDLLLQVGPLIEACRRYRGPTRSGEPARRPRR